MKRLTRSELACNLTLVAVLLASAAHILILTLNLFGVTNFTLPNGFNYIVAYVLVAICLTLYILGFFVARIKRMTFPAWLRIFFYVALFLFTNVYYILGLFFTIIGTIIFYAYLGFLVSVVSVSIFYHSQKDDKNRLKSTYKFITLSVLCYSVAFSTCVQFVISIVKVIFFNNDITANLLFYVISIASMMVVSIGLAIAYYVSLKKSKKFINSCLVKFTKKATVKKSIKEQ